MTLTGVSECPSRALRHLTRGAAGLKLASDPCIVCLDAIVLLLKWWLAGKNLPSWRTQEFSYTLQAVKSKDAESGNHSFLTCASITLSLTHPAGPKSKDSEDGGEGNEQGEGEEAVQVRCLMRTQCLMQTKAWDRLDVWCIPCQRMGYSLEWCPCQYAVLSI